MFATTCLAIAACTAHTRCVARIAAAAGTTAAARCVPRRTDSRACISSSGDSVFNTSAPSSLPAGQSAVGCSAARRPPSSSGGCICIVVGQQGVLRVCLLLGCTAVSRLLLLLLLLG
jgi:hypothetical protein